MTWIEATCPQCGTVECEPAAFELGICNQAESSYYAFPCPACGTRVQKQADERAIELLIAEGVTPHHWTIPAELLEAREGPPLTYDDLLDLHLLLEQPDWFEALKQPAM